MPTQTIEIENIGPVKSLSIPIPEQGGLVVLKGTQGTGKSTVQRAVRRLNGSDDPLEKRDGTTGGSVSGLGVSITVKKSIRRTGELEVESIEGKFSIDDLVDPQIDDPVKADAKRIKALLQLSGADPEQFVNRFEALLGGPLEFARVVGDVEPNGDIVATAAKIKRAIEKAARDIEASADKTAGEAKAFRAEAAGCEGVELRDPADLQADLEDAIRRETQIKSEAAAAERDKEIRRQAQERLDQASAAYTGPTIEEAQAAVDNASDAVRLASRKVAELTKQLVAAQQAEAEAERAEERAEAALSQADTHFRNIAAWQATLGGPGLEYPTGGQLAGAAEAVSLARQEIEKQALARKAKAAEQSAVIAEAQAKQHRERAEALRKAAAKTDDLLSEAVGGLDCPLRVKDGRLVLDTHRGEEHYGELSDGLRILHAVPIAAKNMPEHAMLTIEQWLYGELAPASRAILHKTLVECGVVGVAVEATDDPEIYAEVFDG